MAKGAVQSGGFFLYVYFLLMFQKLLLKAVTNPDLFKRCRRICDGSELI
jgi:hypothetical protein